MTVEQNCQSQQQEIIADKRHYKIGDKTSQGHLIRGIYSCTKNYIIFHSGNGGLSWDISSVPKWASDAIPQCRRLLGISGSLNRGHLSRLNNLLAMALANSWTSEPGTEISDFFNEAENFIAKHKDHTTAILSQGPDFQVFKNKTENVCWHHENPSPHQIKVIEEFQSLQALANSVLPVKYKPTVMRLLGSALSSAFRKDYDDDSIDVLSGARTYITSQIEAYFKVRLFLISFAATFISILLLAFTSSTSDLDNIYLLGTGSGITGAMISALQRNNSISINHYGNITSLYSESLSRLVIGAVFGLFIVFCAKSGIALAPFTDNIHAMACFSFISGFSERFVPDLMSTVSNNRIENN